MQNVRDALARAAALVDAEQIAEAEKIAAQIVRQLPDCAAALVLLGIIARKTARSQDAIDWLRKACCCRPGDAAIHAEFGRALADCRRFDEAVAEFRRAIELNPADAGVCLNLGAALGQMDEPGEALPWCRRAVELAPNDAIAQFNRGNMARALGLLEEATAALATAVRLAPDFAAAHWNLGYCYLLAGDFRRGWGAHEWRVAAGEVAIDDYPQPRWKGESLEGRTILIHGEQGIGDEILFASCLPEVIQRAAHCVVVCEPRLVPLFRRSFARATVCGFSRRQDRQGAQLAGEIARIDVQIPTGSLPLFLRPARDSFPLREQFLTADPGRVAEWRRRLGDLGPGLKIGISWRTGGQPGERRMRTTALEQWRGLLSLPGICWVNLQYGDCVDELAAARREIGVEIHDWPEADPLVEMDAFAAKVAALDLVLSVDNSTVHLSGALGVPTWAFLPHVPSWRWTIADSRSVWYPSLRLFRQTERGDWSALLARVGQMLATVANSAEPAAALQALLEERAEGALIRGRALVWNVCRRSPLTPDPSPTEGRGGREPPVPAAMLPADGATSAEIGWGPTIRAAIDAHERRDFATAERLCREVLNHSPRNVQATNLLGALAAQTGRLDLAIRTLGRAAAWADDDLIVSLNMAGALADSGHLDRAIDTYRRIIQRQGHSFEAWLGCAKALQTAARHDEAIAAARQALRIRPDHHKTFNLLGVWCLAAGRLSEAETALREAVRLRPDYMAAHNNLGIAIEQQGRLEDAKNCFARAFELDRTCLQAANNFTSVNNKLRQPAIVPLTGH
jgi:tetratricopeptide (TPR) repeat protein